MYININDNTDGVANKDFDDGQGSVFQYEYVSTSDSWDGNAWKLSNILTNDDCDGHFGSSVILAQNNGLLIGCAGEDNSTGSIIYYKQPEETGEEYDLHQRKSASDHFGG